MYAVITTDINKKIRTWEAEIIEIIPPMSQPTNKQQELVPQEKLDGQSAETRIIFRDVVGNTHLLTLSFRTIIHKRETCPICKRILDTGEKKDVDNK